MSRVGVIVIGRNEGERLIACLDSLQGQADRLIYVDSGSTDDSVTEARKRGAEVVILDDSVPHTAARGRNAGAELAALDCDYLQFVDGDCKVVAGWIDAGRNALEANPNWGLVTGWRSEIHPDASVFNAMADVEWHRPAGQIAACGGDMMVRAEAFTKAGGFDPTVIAAEDDEFCQRVGKAGYALHRLPEAMTEHDLAMTVVPEWWRRCLRSGHGFAQVGHLHPGYFASEKRRALVFGVALPILAFGFAVFWPWGLLLVLALYGFSYVRTTQGLSREGLPVATAAHHAAYYTGAKIPHALGMGLFHWRRTRGSAMQLVEYK